MHVFKKGKEFLVLENSLASGSLIVLLSPFLLCTHYSKETLYRRSSGQISPELVLLALSVKFKCVSPIILKNGITYEGWHLKTIECKKV